jgi:hypothetical protein
MRVQDGLRERFEQCSAVRKQVPACYLRKLRASGPVYPHGLVAVRIALAGPRAFKSARAEKARLLDLHRQFNRPSENRSYLAGAVLDQLFQDRLNGVIPVPLLASTSANGRSARAG